MEVKDKTQFWAGLIAVLISLGLVVVVIAATTIGNDVSVGGNLNVAGNASTTGTLDIVGNFRVNTNKLTVIAASGNTAIAGTLDVAGVTTITNNLVATGTATFGTNFEIDASGNASTTGTFIAATTTVDNLQIGGGTRIKKHISETASIDFPSVATTTCYATSTSVSATDGDIVIASPTPVGGGINDTDLTWNAFASSSLAWIRVCNPTSVNDQDPASQTWRFDIWQH